MKMERWGGGGGGGVVMGIRLKTRGTTPETTEI